MIGMRYDKMLNSSLRRHDCVKKKALIPMVHCEVHNIKTIIATQSSLEIEFTIHSNNSAVTSTRVYCSHQNVSRWFFANKKLIIMSTAVNLCYVADEVMT